MKALLHTTWFPLVMLVGCVAMSLSFSTRILREEGEIRDRLQRNLEQIQSLRAPLAGDAMSLIVLDDPLHGIPPNVLATLKSNGEIVSVDVGADWMRRSSSYTISSLPPDQLGALLEALQQKGRGWWVTGLTLETREDGLAGQLRLEALDKEIQGE